MIDKLIEKYGTILNTLRENKSSKSETDDYDYNTDIKNTREYLKDLKALNKQLTIPVVVCSAFAKEMYSKINESTRDHKNKNAPQIYKDDALEMVEETVAFINGKYK